MDSSSVAESSHVALYGAVAVGLFSLWYFFGPSTARTKVRSKEVGYSNTGKHGAPRRHIHSVTKLRGPPPTHKSLHDILRVAKDKFGDAPALGSRKLVKVHTEKRVIDGVEKAWQYFELAPYEWKTYADTYELACAFGCGLVHYGLKSGDRLGIYEDTRQEWTLTMHGAFAQGIVGVTVYANLGSEGLEHALREGQLKYLFTNGKLIPTICKIADNCHDLKYVIFTDEVDENAKKQASEKNLTLIPFDDVLEQGKKNPVSPAPGMGDELAVIMYTSGSTGPPKGVMITHHNILTIIQGVMPRVGLNKDDVYISYLPLAHVLALVSELACLQSGVAVGHANARSLLDSAVRNCEGDLKALRPTLMAGVPTVWDRVRKGALAKLEKASPIARNLFNFCYARKEAAIKRGSDTPVANALVFKKFQDTLGGRVRLLITGGAPLSAATHTFLRVCFGVPVMQGYGLTETCGGATLQEPDETTALRSGPPLLCCEIRLDDCPDMGYTSNDKPFPRGEICIRGGNVALGYYNNEEKTKEDFVDGWFHTGDIGQWCEDGTLAIIDRKKNLVKLSHGEYIALERLESVYKTCPFIENICVYGDSYQQYPVALVYPNPDRVREWAEKNNASKDFNDLCNNQELKGEILKQIGETGRKAGFKGFEIVRNVHLCAEEWTPENGYLTAAMKIKRTPLYQAYRKEIDAMYN